MQVRSCPGGQVLSSGVQEFLVWQQGSFDAGKTGWWGWILPFPSRIGVCHLRDTFNLTSRGTMRLGK